MEQHNGVIGDGEIRHPSLGNALKYGILVELPHCFKREGNELIHFYGSLFYLYLHDFLPDVTRIHTLLFTSGAVLEKLDETIESVSSVIFSGIREKMQFNDFSDLVEKLNALQKDVPEWYFFLGKRMVCGLASNVFLYKDMLYYLIPLRMGKKEGGNLVRIDPDFIVENSDLDSDFCDDVLAHGVNGMFFDKKNGKIFYLSYSQRHFYYCYDISREETFLYHDILLFLIEDGIPVIITKDGFLAYVADEEVHCLKKYENYEVYEYHKEEKCFWVRARAGSGKFARPYKLYPDGKTAPADENVYKEILWRHIKGEVCRKRLMREQMYLYKYELPKKDEDKAPETITVESMIQAFLPSFSEQDIEENELYFHKILQILASVFGSEKDISEALYTLCEADSELGSGNFPSKRLWQSIGRMMEENQTTEKKLEIILKSENYALLREELLKEKKTPSPKYTEPAGRIGTFYQHKPNKGFLRVHVNDKTEGRVFGSLILPVMDFSESESGGNNGIVFYDMKTAEYTVQTNFPLKDIEKRFVTAKFALLRETINYIIQKK